MNRMLIMVLLTVCAFGCSEDQEQAIVPQEFPEFVDGTLQFQSNERKYTLHIPDSYDGTEDFPLVVFLHGGGGNAASAQGFTNFNQVSDDNDFLVVYPQAFFASAPNSFVWADGRGLGPDKLGIDDVGFIDELVSNLKGEYSIDASKVYLCGFSNGSFLTQLIAFERNDQFAAIGTLGGTMSVSLFESGNPGRAIPMIYVFGTDDPLVPYDGGFVSGNPDLEAVVGVEQAVDFWVGNNQVQSTPTTRDIPNVNTTDNSTVTIFEYEEGDCDSKVVFYKVNGGGHTWPGVAVPNQQTLGQTNLDVLASQELWDFFDQFELCF
ncbi:MAG: PHB depolymerase family esterase [Bacteroidota bacterium]